MISRKKKGHKKIDHENNSGQELASYKVYVTQHGTAVAVELAPYGPIGPLRVLIMVTLYDFNQNVAQNDICELQ